MTSESVTHYAEPDEDIGHEVLADLADDPRMKEVKTVLWRQLKQELASQRDPRIIGNGDIFDYYPNRQISRQQQLYNAPDYDPVGEFETRFGSPQTP